MLEAANTAAMIVWSTLVHRHVEPEMLGRMTSLDMLVSTGLVPVSFALTGPIAALVGVEATLIGAGVLAAASFTLLLVPGSGRS